MPGYGMRKFEFARSKNNSNTVQLGPLREVLSSSRSAAIVRGRFYVRITASGYADGVVTADTDNGSTGRPIWGLAEIIYDSKGRIKDNQILETTDAGFVQGYEDLANIVFRGLADGALAASTLSVKMAALGTITSKSTDDTYSPEPDPNDKLTNADESSTSGHHAFNIIKADPDLRNTATARVWEFMVAPDFRANV